MCMMSYVMDQWRPYIPAQWPPPIDQPVPPNIVITQPPLSEEDVRKLIDAFRNATAAAKVFDDITGQPDCVDPEKEKLLDRVAELERQLDEVRKAAR